jgi:hypothetical protein
VNPQEEVQNEIVADEREPEDVANVKFYDAILRTPFPRKLGVILDFLSPVVV